MRDLCSEFPAENPCPTLASCAKSNRTNTAAAEFLDECKEGKAHSGWATYPLSQRPSNRNTVAEDPEHNHQTSVLHLLSTNGLKNLFSLDSILSCKTKRFVFGIRSVEEHNRGCGLNASNWGTRAQNRAKSGYLPKQPLIFFRGWGHVFWLQNQAARICYVLFSFFLPFSFVFHQMLACSINCSFKRRNVESVAFRTTEVFASRQRAVLMLARSLTDYHHPFAHVGNSNVQ